jgi:hypothetical protein
MLQSAAKAAPVQKRNDESGEVQPLLFQTGPLVASVEVKVLIEDTVNCSQLIHLSNGGRRDQRHSLSDLSRASATSH